MGKVPGGGQGAKLPLKLKAFLSIFIQKRGKMMAKVKDLNENSPPPVFEADCFTQLSSALSVGQWGAWSAHTWIYHCK